MASVLEGNGTPNRSCPNLSVIYFLHYESIDNESIKNDLNEEWPCEVRIYWIEIQNLVSLVQFLFRYGTIALVTIGLVINICSLVVLNSPPINKCNISVYLIALAISDIGVLIFNVCVGMLRARSEVISTLYEENWMLCKLDSVLFIVFIYFSSWLIVAITFERLLMIKNPFKIHTWQNKKPARITVAALALIIFGISYARSRIKGFEQDNMYGYKPCGANDHSISANVLPFVILNVYFPFILIIVSNCYLVMYVWRSAQEYAKMKVTDDQANVYKVTRVLLIVSVGYILFYLPLGIVTFVEIYNKSQKPHRSDTTAYIQWKKNMLLFRWIRGLFFFLYLINFINNFFLYCLSGNIFRQTVRRCVTKSLKRVSFSGKADNLSPQTTRTESKKSSSSLMRKIRISEMFYSNPTYVKDKEEEEDIEQK